MVSTGVSLGMPLPNEATPGPVSSLPAALVALVTRRLRQYGHIPRSLGVSPLASVFLLPKAFSLNYMKCELALRRWATLAHVLLLLCGSSTLTMAFCVHQSRHLRSSANALRLRHHSSGPVVAEALSSSAATRRRGLRRARATVMVHSDAYGGGGGVTSTPSHAKVSALPTAMDRVLPFGRCVGVALPLTLTDDVMRAAEEELLPEEIAYCVGLPKSLQVGLASGGELDHQDVLVHHGILVLVLACQKCGGIVMFLLLAAGLDDFPCWYLL